MTLICAVCLTSFRSVCQSVSRAGLSLSLSLSLCASLAQTNEPLEQQVIASASLSAVNTLKYSLLLAMLYYISFGLD